MATLAAARIYVVHRNLAPRQTPEQRYHYLRIDGARLFPRRKLTADGYSQYLALLRTALRDNSTLAQALRAAVAAVEAGKTLMIVDDLRALQRSAGHPIAHAIVRLVAQHEAKTAHQPNDHADLLRPVQPAPPELPPRLSLAMVRVVVQQRARAQARAERYEDLADGGTPGDGRWQDALGTPFVLADAARGNAQADDLRTLEREWRRHDTEQGKAFDRGYWQRLFDDTRHYAYRHSLRAMQRQWRSEGCGAAELRERSQSYAKLPQRTFDTVLSDAVYHVQLWGKDWHRAIPTDRAVALHEAQVRADDAEIVTALDAWDGASDARPKQRFARSRITRRNTAPLPVLLRVWPTFVRTARELAK